MSEKMLALVNYAERAGAVELREVPVPSLGEEDVLLEVKAVGICGSDLHQYHATHSWKVNYPVILGHEYAGVVVAKGARVRRFQEGDRVTGETAAVVDPDSPFTRRGLYNLDPARLGFGYGVDGAMARYVRVPERCLHLLPDALPFERAALTEPCCVAYNAVCMNARIRPGDAVAVLGPGPIGILCTLIARLNGANPLVVYGLPADRHRLEAARAVGATHVFALSPQEMADTAKHFGDGYGFDVVVDASGASASLQTAMQLARPTAQIVKVGWGPQPCDYSLDPVVAKNLTIQGSFSHNWPVWERVLAMLASGQIDLQPVLNRVAPLPQWRECFEAMACGEVVKAVLIPV
ncbi:MAG TPA: zinc-binding dehydrogenase [Chthonomonas sp.]|uniref:zinc-binding dehydrogenase n=1 Tax=Chthonomonas sp. TaxID=2282153 RepID=UPI002B4B8A70|nr:zinc-binding dehydrogenase [Chthonomonas sp.]HLI49665.1 zinc-binding dehydrogenase [Chthonomonas sp.]